MQVTYLCHSIFVIFWQPSCKTPVSFSVSFADFLRQEQAKKYPDPAQWDYEYIEYYKKAMANSTDLNTKTEFLYCVKHQEAYRDFYTESLRHINHLYQIDEMPNLELKEPRCEIYKISLSFRAQRKS